MFGALKRKLIHVLGGYTYQTYTPEIDLKHYLREEYGIKQISVQQDYLFMFPEVVKEIKQQLAHKVADQIVQYMDWDIVRKRTVRDGGGITSYDSVKGTLTVVIPQVAKEVESERSDLEY